MSLVAGSQEGATTTATTYSGLLRNGGPIVRADSQDKPPPILLPQRGLASTFLCYREETATGAGRQVVPWCRKAGLVSFAPLAAGLVLPARCRVGLFASMLWVQG